MSLLSPIKYVIYKLRFYVFRKKWRKNNQHNFTTAGNMFNSNQVQVGIYTYGKLNVFSCDNQNPCLKIGKYCSIADEVCFLLAGGHNMSSFSSYPFKAKLKGDLCESLTKGDIIVEDDVWIGFRSTILSGVTIGKGSVVAAGAVVTKNVPPFSVVGGVPAKVIKFRFSKEKIDLINTLDYSRINLSKLDILYLNVENMTLDEIKKYIQQIMTE